MSRDWKWLAREDSCGYMRKKNLLLTSDSQANAEFVEAFCFQPYLHILISGTLFLITVDIFTCQELKLKYCKLSMWQIWITFSAHLPFNSFLGETDCKRLCR